MHELHQANNNISAEPGIAPVILTDKELLLHVNILEQNYLLAMAQSRDDIITMNIVSLVQAKKYYDAAKLNFKYQQNEEDSAAVSVPLLLARLKEDTQEMLKVNSEKGRRLSKVTVQRLTSAMIDINKIS